MIDLVVSDAADEALQSICATKKLALRTLETRCNERSTTQSETDAVRVGSFSISQPLEIHKTSRPGPVGRSLKDGGGDRRRTKPLAPRSRLRITFPAAGPKNPALRWQC
jgi:hypothetical protein